MIKKSTKWIKSSITFNMHHWLYRPSICLSVRPCVCYRNSLNLYWGTQPTLQGSTFLPHSAHLGISAQLKFWQVADFKIDYKVELLLSWTTRLPMQQTHPTAWIEVSFSQQQLIGSFSNFKLKLEDKTKAYRCIKWRWQSMEDDLKILKEDYLSNHLSDPTQILNLSLDDQTNVYKCINWRWPSMKEDLK